MDPAAHVGGRRSRDDPDLAAGTINIIVSVPVPLGDEAYVNAVITATEAKTQASTRILPRSPSRFASRNRVDRVW
jgi:adenosylcobinamide amidohydrolase